MATGAAAAKGTASHGIKDSYTGLKSLIQRRFSGKAEAEMVLAKYGEKPKVWEEPLKNALAQIGANKDEEIVRQAQQVMKLIKPQQASHGKYNIQICEGKGIVIGGDAQVTQNFGKD